MSLSYLDANWKPHVERFLSVFERCDSYFSSNVENRTVTKVRPPGMVLERSNRGRLRGRNEDSSRKPLPFQRRGALPRLAHERLVLQRIETDLHICQRALQGGFG